MQNIKNKLRNKYFVYLSGFTPTLHLQSEFLLVNIFPSVPHPYLKMIKSAYKNSNNRFNISATNCTTA